MYNKHLTADDLIDIAGFLRALVSEHLKQGLLERVLVQAVNDAVTRITRDPEDAMRSFLAIRDVVDLHQPKRDADLVVVLPSGWRGDGRCGFLAKRLSKFADPERLGGISKGIHTFYGEAAAARIRNAAFGRAMELLASDFKASLDLPDASAESVGQIQARMERRRSRDIARQAVIPKPKQESGGVETALDRQEGIRMAALIEELLGTGATPHNGNSFQWVHRAH